MKSWSAARWREYGLRLVLELLVVFAGVYGASALADYQRAKELAERRAQIQDALIEEIEAITNDARNFPGQIGPLLEQAAKASSDVTARQPLRPQDRKSVV